jgi:hypothetical protein
MMPFLSDSANTPVPLHSVARDRSWYTTYTPFQTFTEDFMGVRTEVVGVGTVHIPVELFPNGPNDPEAHGTLRLRNVLHAPTAPCNIVGSHRTCDYARIQIGGLEDGDGAQGAAILDGNGRRIGYFEVGDRVKLWFLRLSRPPRGPVVGPSLLGGGPGTVHMIHASWLVTQRRRWATALALSCPSDDPPSSTDNKHEALEISSATNGSQATQVAPWAPYTVEERDWMQRQWGGEFLCFANHGMSINDQTDRSDGRKILRVLMARDRPASDDTPTANVSGLRKEPSGEPNTSPPLDSEIRRDDESKCDSVVDQDEDSNDIERSTSSAADHNFTDEELDFIGRGWGNSERFMLSLGLRFYIHDDCEEAKTVVRALIAEE